MAALPRGNRGASRCAGFRICAGSALPFDASGGHEGIDHSQGRSRLHDASRDRVGGRVWSQELAPGDLRSVVERGGEFVLDGYDVMRTVVAELGLELADMTMSYYEREPRGAGLATHQEVARCAAVVAGAAASAPPGRSLAEVVSRWHGSPAALAAYMSRAEVTNGVDAGVLAATAVTDVTAGFARRPCWRVAGGNQRVAQGLAGRLGMSVWRGGHRGWQHYGPSCRWTLTGHCSPPGTTTHGQGSHTPRSPSRWPTGTTSS